MKLTTSSAAPAPEPAPVINNQKEWMRVKDVVLEYGIGRSTVFVLIRAGFLPSVSLKKPGNVRGIRLISRSGINHVLETLATFQKEVS